MASVVQRLYSYTIASFLMLKPELMSDHRAQTVQPHQITTTSHGPALGQGRALVKATN
ncbi:hypothetical protein J6590_000201 [Homalodisca vitripennis]|nr:hypothetical protein J6590_000201 [Homalodisca vitripennis]